MQVGTLFPLFLPSFFLLGTIGSPGGEVWIHHREVFGGPSHYLTLDYGAAPQGWLTSSAPLRFNGILVTDEGEWRVFGKKARSSAGWRYEIMIGSQRYYAEMKNPVCPGFLDFSAGNEGLLKKVSLRAGNCPTSI